MNARITQTLTAATGIDLGKNPEDWRKWWIEEQGYAYESPPSRPKLDLTVFVDTPTYLDSVHYSCFAAGTPVHTITGLRPIESVEIGDQVLTQDPRTGAIGFQPVLAAVHNKPDRLWKIKLGDETIRATGIHRFWKVGQGWVKARDLKPADIIRTLGGVAEVARVDLDSVQPVFNLDVYESESFFVGESGTLVHDNSPVQRVAQPFDAPSRREKRQSLFKVRRLVPLPTAIGGESAMSQKRRLLGAAHHQVEVLHGHARRPLDQIVEAGEHHDSPSHDPHGDVAEVGERRILGRGQVADDPDERTCARRTSDKGPAGRARWPGPWAGHKSWRRCPGPSAPGGA